MRISRITAPRPPIVEWLVDGDSYRRGLLCAPVPRGVGREWRKYLENPLRFLSKNFQLFSVLQQLVSPPTISLQNNGVTLRTASNLASSLSLITSLSRHCTSLLRASVSARANALNPSIQHSFVSSDAPDLSNSCSYSHSEFLRAAIVSSVSGNFFIIRRAAWSSSAREAASDS